MKIDFTHISSKGQIVIPRDMREGFEEGQKFLLIREGDEIILKKADGLRKNLEADLAFARRTREAWKRYDEGKFVSANKDEFLSDLDRW